MNNDRSSLMSAHSPPLRRNQYDTQQSYQSPNESLYNQSKNLHFLPKHSKNAESLHFNIDEVQNQTHQPQVRLIHHYINNTQTNPIKVVTRDEIEVPFKKQIEQQNHLIKQLQDQMNLQQSKLDSHEVTRSTYIKEIERLNKVVDEQQKEIDNQTNEFDDKVLKQQQTITHLQKVNEQYVIQLEQKQKTYDLLIKDKTDENYNLKIEMKTLDCKYQSIQQELLSFQLSHEQNQQKFNKMNQLQENNQSLQDQVEQLIQYTQQKDQKYDSLEKELNIWKNRFITLNKEYHQKNESIMLLQTEVESLKAKSDYNKENRIMNSPAFRTSLGTFNKIN